MPSNNINTVTKEAEHPVRLNLQRANSSEEEFVTQPLGTDLKIFSLHEVPPLETAEPVIEQKNSASDDVNANAQKIKKVLSEWGEKYNVPSKLLALLEAFIPFSRHDNNTRKLTLANELGEAAAPVLRLFHPLAAKLGLVGGWSATLGYFFGRSSIIGVREQKITACFKTMLHDLIAGALIPVSIIRSCFKLTRDRFKSVPSLIKNVMTAAVSLGGANFAIKVLDPILEQSLEALAQKMPREVSTSINNFVAKKLTALANRLWTVNA